MATTHPIQLYGHPLSGHAHRARLALALMDIPHTLVEVDLMQGAHKTPEFRQRNPFGQVPVLDDNGHIVFDSNAILVYLAQTYDTQARWYPRDPKGQADVQVWLSVAAGLIAFGPAAARLVTVFGAKFNPQEVIDRAHGLFAVMETQLGNHPWLVGDRATIADIACYSYVAAAPEGNVSLAAYPNLRAWLARIEALPGFVAMQKTKVGLAT